LDGIKETLNIILSTWWGLTLLVLAVLALFVLLSAVLYRQFFKRLYDIILSGISLIVLFPVLVLLIILGAINMKGNPFFVQKRPGKKEKIFNLIKFRTMNNKRDENGNLLSDELRLTKYGRLLRSTSLDELPELINIFKGDMSIVGPRPLLVKYLSLYNVEQRRRHNVRPGLTGLAQVSGRNSISWEKRFFLDVEYVNNVTLFNDIRIIFLTIINVINKNGISSETSETMEEFIGNDNKEKQEEVAINE